MSKLFSLHELSCPQIWNIEQEKDREEKVDRRPAKLNETKGDRDLERELKKTKETFFLLEEHHANFVAVVSK